MAQNLALKNSNIQGWAKENRPEKSLKNGWRGRKNTVGEKYHGKEHKNFFNNVKKRAVVSNMKCCCVLKMRTFRESI